MLSEVAAITNRPNTAADLMASRHAHISAADKWQRALAAAADSQRPIQFTIACVGRRVVAEIGRRHIAHSGLTVAYRGCHLGPVNVARPKRRIA